MNIQHLSLAVLALCGAISLAVAQPNEAPNEVPGNEAYYFEHPWERYRGPYDHRWFNQRQQDYRQHNYPGAGPERDLRIGQRLPPRYRNSQYLVENWRAHRLMAPPPGYQWYQVGADYVLINMASGQIAQSRTGR